MGRLNRIFLFLVLIVGAGASTGPVYAADEVAETAPEAGETNEQGQFELPEVTVTDAAEGTETEGYIAEDANTATKTDAPILLTPFSVEVIDRDLMDDQYATNLDDVLRNVAGVIPGGYYKNYDYYRIRGFESGNNTFLDGLPLRRYISISEEVFGLERVEVLKGPASALYGYSNVGGLVNMVSKRPRPGGFADLHVGVGNYDFVEVGADVGGSLVESGAITGRFNALYRRQGTFTDFLDTGERIYAAPAVSIALGPNTDLTILTQFVHDNVPVAMPLVAPGTVLNNPNGRLPISRNLGEPGYQNITDSTRTLLGYQFSHNFNEVFSFRQNFRYRWQDTKFGGIYNSILEPDMRTLTRFVYESHEKNKAINVDNIGAAKFETGPVKHYAFVGADFFYETADFSATFAGIAPIDIFDPVYGAEPGEFAPIALQRDTQKQLGIYAQEQALLWDQLMILVGGRWDFVWTDNHDRMLDIEYKKDDNKFSPRVGIAWEFVPGVSVYGNYSRSFYPQVGSTDALGKPLPPETGEQWEGGFKTLYFEGRLQSTVSVYQITKENVAIEDPLNPGFSINTGKQRSRGFEVEVAANAAPGWDFIGAYAYTDAEVLKDTFIPEGTPTINVPKNALSLWTKYVLQTGPLRGLGAGVGGQYYSKQSGDLLNTFDLPSYWLAEAAAYYSRGRFRAQVNIENLFDKRYFPASYSYEYVIPGDPFMIRGQVGFTF